MAGMIENWNMRLHKRYAKPKIDFTGGSVMIKDSAGLNALNERALTREFTKIIKSRREDAVVKPIRTLCLVTKAPKTHRVNKHP
jgi:hypothetical protein